MDKTDKDLIELLRQDPRSGNRQLAQELNLSESTVAARVRSLFERAIVRTTVQIDVAKMGNEIFAHVDVFVAGRPIDEVIADLCALEEVIAVTSSLGAAEIVIQILAKDNLSLVREILPRIGKIKGVKKLEPDISLEVLKYSVEYGILE